MFKTNRKVSEMGKSKEANLNDTLCYKPVKMKEFEIMTDLIC